MKLYSYYRSTAAYRVRIAMQYKKLGYEYIPVNLLAGEQREKNFSQVNPQGRVPTLVDGDFVLGQSMTILEYLEECYPAPALLPKDPKARAWIRWFSQIIACDIHPLNNTSILKYLREPLGHNDEQVQQWYHHWLKQGFDALEELLRTNLDRKNYCWGDSVTFADVCLIPQVYNAHRFKFPMNNYPLINQINDFCLTLPYFEKARPENQPDARD